MLVLADLQELTRDYENGDLLWSDAYPALLSLIANHDVEVIAGSLSPVLATLFIEALRAEFADDHLAVTGLWIDNAGGEPPNRQQIVNRVRAWLERDVASQRGSNRIAP